MMAVKPIPDGYHTLTPVLTAQGAAKLIEFLKQAFDAKESYGFSRPWRHDHACRIEDRKLHGHAR